MNDSKAIQLILKLFFFVGNFFFGGVTGKYMAVLRTLDMELSAHFLFRRNFFDGRLFFCQKAFLRDAFLFRRRR